ncbi:hypothetical protein HAZT_HAZT003441 [Hyalella azteca]|uniref:Uncharacterized protein n=1 Tax=Hyalella azteca TaxID=294128 RepID=A0A6A0H6N1_HYAAZ|nr:hypothetical protein HAZT_HAZT003441 [Hyalella azteca]
MENGGTGSDNVPSSADVTPYPYLANVPFDFVDADVGLLIGMNMSGLLKPTSIEGSWNEPIGGGQPVVGQGDQKPEDASREQALSRFLLSLKKKFAKNEQFFKDYSAFMQEMMDKNFMEPVPERSSEPSQEWFLVHHAVYHNHKPKIRDVFDCSLKFQGISLNDRLLQGPDLTNNLLGVLLRFREESDAVVGDIEKMYYQVKVPSSQANFLKLFFVFTGAEAANLEDLSGDLSLKTELGRPPSTITFGILEQMGRKLEDT